MTKYSLNFRATAGAWGETPPSGGVIGTATLYPQSIAGLTVGWATAAPTISDYTGATNAKLSGRHSSNSDANFFRIDLPLGPGTYRVWMAIGTLSGSTTTAFSLRDASGNVISAVGSTVVAGNANPALANVMDATGAIVPYNTYISTDGGTFVQFTTLDNNIRLFRNGVALQVANIMLEAVSVPLDPAVLTTEFGTGTHSGSIRPKEPQGHRFGRVTAPTGLQNFSIVGTSTYFTLETDASGTWLAATGTRIPDGWTGSVTVRQTSGGLTRDTTFNFTAGTLSRPVTGLLGRVSSDTLIQRTRVKSVMDAECWQGYGGQSLASDQIVTSRADFVAKFNALPVTGWHRLRLQNGDYTGVGTLTAKDWIANGGGVVIEPDAGHDPIFRCDLQGCNQRGVHYRGLRVVPMASSVESVWNCGIGAPYPVYRVENCRIGYAYAPGFNVADWLTWSTIMDFEFCEEVSFINNDFDGIGNGFIISGGRRMRFQNNRWKRVARDIHACSTAFRFNTPRGVFSDNLTYVEISDCTCWFGPDIYTGLSSGATPHSDWLQIRRTGGAAYPTTTAGVNGSAGLPWAVGNIGFTPSVDRLYTVVSVTGDALINPASPPTGTGTGIVSGNVTFDYLQDYTLATEMVILLEGNCVMLDGVTVNAPGTAQPNVQFTINSNSGWKNTFTFVAINNLCASTGSRGLEGGGLSETTVHAEWNSFVSSAAKALNNDQAYIVGGTLRAHRNIVGLVSGEPYLISPIARAAYGNVAVNFQTGATSPNRPGDVLRGSFTDLGGSLGWGYTMIDDDTVTAAEFRSNMSKQLHHLTGAAGAKLREVHTVTVGVDSFPLIVNP